MTPKPASGLRRALPGLQAALALTGHGLLLWLGISTPLLHPAAVEALSLRGPQQLMLAAGMALSALALLPLRDAGPAPAPHPGRTRALAAALLAAAGLLAWQIRGGHPDPGWLAIDGIAVVIAALLAMLDLGARSAATPSSLQAPLAGALALLAGAAALFWLAAEKWAGGGLAALSVPPLLLLMLPAAALTLADWRERGVLRPLSRRRIIVLALLFGLPLACAGLMWWVPEAARAAWRIAAPAVLAGFVLERAGPGLRAAAGGASGAG